MTIREKGYRYGDNQLSAPYQPSVSQMPTADRHCNVKVDIKKKNVAKVSENKVFSVSKELPLSKFIKEMYELYEICNNNN